MGSNYHQLICRYESERIEKYLLKFHVSLSPQAVLIDTLIVF